MKRRSKHGAQAITALVLLLGIFLILNLISAQVFSRLDLTEGKIYTLSDGSKELVANLEDPLTVKVFFSENLPAPYNANARYLRDLLDDYKTYSHGKFHYEFVDPSSEADLEKQARDFQVPPVQVNTVEKDQLQVKKVYMGLVFLYRDKHETIPVVQTTTGLEYEISSTIKYLTSAERTKVGVLQGLGAPDFYQEMNNFRSLLEKNYETTTVDLSGAKLVPEDVDILLVAGIKEDVDDWTKFAVDQFIMRGGRAAFLLNKVSADLQTQMARKAPFKIDDWTKTYGFKINDDLVMDVHCGMVQMQQRMGFFTISNAVNYPFFPLVTSFNPENDIVKDLENLILFFPSSIDTSYAAADTLINLTPLFYSSDKSKVQSGRFDINPPEKIDPTEYNGGPYVLGVTVEGEFTSFFADKEIPQGNGGAEPQQDLEIIPASEPTRLVAIGDGHLVQDTFLNDPSNLAFLLNMVDWLAGEEDLIGLRTREVTNRPIAEVSAGLKTGIKYANIFIPPIVVILIGVIRWQIRRRRKNLEF